MLSFKQLKQKLMNDLKQRVIKNYAYDKKADDDIHYHLNFGEKNITTKKSRDEVLIEMILTLRNEMNQGFKILNERMDKLEKRMDNLENRMDKLENRMGNLEKRMDQLENQAIVHGWNIKKI